MKKINSIIAVLCMISVHVNAQNWTPAPKWSKEDIQPYLDQPNYRIGEQVPDFGNLKVINAVKPVMKLSDLKEDLVILDFWGRGCKSCIEDMPRMAAVQREFTGKVKILPVTNENGVDIAAFWQSNPYLKKLNLPSVVEDKVLWSHFKFTQLGLHVWIYKGKVIGLTTADYADGYNINLVLTGRIPNWPVWNDFYQQRALTDRNPKVLFALDPKQVDTANTMIRYAAIAGYKEEGGVDVMSMGIIKDGKRKTVRTYFVNSPIYAAYLTQWMNAGKFADLVKPSLGFTNNQVAWEVADKSRYEFEKKPGAYIGDWKRDNAICYEAIVPDSNQTNQQIAKMIISDMDRLLGLHVRWEKRNEKVLVLVRTSQVDKFVKAEDLPDDQRLSVSTIDYYMNEQASNPYVFNETKYEGEKMMKVKITDWTDIPAIRKAIAPYGLDLKEEERLVDKFVFTEVDGGLLVDGKMIQEAKAKRAVQKDMPVPTAEEGKAFLEANKNKPGVVTLSSGLQYKVIKQGTGIKPVWDKEKKVFDEVKIHYTGMLINGKIFDSSLERGAPFTRALVQTISGWQEALKLMPVGSKWEIYVPAELAYGNKAAGPIPAGSALIFEIELLDIAR